jgi:hypothetical protein
MRTNDNRNNSIRRTGWISALLLMILATLGQWVMAVQPTNEHVLIWGPATNGCQLGVEFLKTNFTMGEPLVATIRLRNLGQRTFGYTGTGSPYDFEVIFLSLDGNPVKGKSNDPTGFFGTELDRSGSFRWISVAPGEEVKINRRLDDRFLLAAGEYMVSLKHVLADTAWTNRVGLTSGSVRIHLAR